MEQFPTKLRGFEVFHNDLTYYKDNPLINVRL